MATNKQGTVRSREEVRTIKKIFRKQGTVWSREEVRTLKKIFRSTSNSAVAVVLARSPKSVERKAAQLGLTKTKKYLRALGRNV